MVTAPPAGFQDSTSSVSTPPTGEAALSQQNPAHLIEVNTPVVDLSLQVPAASEILPGLAPAAPASQDYPDSGGQPAANPASSTAPAPASAATALVGASKESAPTNPSASRETTSASSQSSTSATNMPAASIEAAPPALELVEGLGPWLSNPEHVVSSATGPATAPPQPVRNNRTHRRTPRPRTALPFRRPSSCPKSPGRSARMAGLCRGWPPLACSQRASRASRYSPFAEARASLLYLSDG